jgi:hypothetical protein
MALSRNKRNRWSPKRNWEHDFVILPSSRLTNTRGGTAEFCKNMEVAARANKSPSPWIQGQGKKGHGYPTSRIAGPKSFCVLLTRKTSDCLGRLGNCRYASCMAKPKRWIKVTGESGVAKQVFLFSTSRSKKGVWIDS